MAGKNAYIRGKKTHVYRVAGMIASIRGKKPHVYRVIMLKQMADHNYLAVASIKRIATLRNVPKLLTKLTDMHRERNYFEIPRTLSATINILIYSRKK